MPNFPDNSPVLNPNKFEILENLIFDTGEFAQKKLIDDTLNNNHVDATLLIGEGGIGKSSVLAQWFRAIRLMQPSISPIFAHSNPEQKSLATKISLSKLNKYVLPVLLPFDRAVQQVVKRKGDRHQSTWQPEEWHAVSEEILLSMGPKLEEIAHHNRKAEIYGIGPRWRLVSDPVCLGDYDKGREAVKVMARNPNVRLWGLISDARNKNRASRLRVAVTDPGLSAERIEQIFVDEGIVLDIDDFGRVPDLMRKMATAQLMEASDAQVERQIDTLVSEGVINFDDYPLPETVIGKIENQTPGILLDKTIAYYKRRFPHMMWVLRCQMQGSQTRINALFNININDKPVHWYQSDLEQAMQGSS